MDKRHHAQSPENKTSAEMTKSAPKAFTVGFSMSPDEVLKPASKPCNPFTGCHSGDRCSAPEIHLSEKNFGPAKCFCFGTTVRPN